MAHVVEVKRRRVDVHKWVKSFEARPNSTDGFCSGLNDIRSTNTILNQHSEPNDTASPLQHPALSSSSLYKLRPELQVLSSNKQAMNAGDNEMVEGSISSILVDSLESNKNGDALSPEDVAWVDSCLVNDREISDGDWSSLKDPESHDSSEPGTDDLPRAADVLMVPSDEAVNLQSSVVTDYEVEVATINKELEMKSKGFPINEETDVSPSQLFQGEFSETSLKHAFSPNYKEDDDFKMSPPVGSGLDLAFSGYDTEPSTEDIFKVWDLDIPDEEDELVKQLNKALSENPAQSTAPSDDSGVLKDLKEESLDSLINSIADLSLDQHS
uniref:Uncharacterized protein n=1 Tax=Salix viminalis TaxID=40686 RepID=A0A6N2L6U6_SALVM